MQQPLSAWVGQGDDGSLSPWVDFESEASALVMYQPLASLVLLENKVASLFLDEQEHIDAYIQSWDEVLRLSHDEDASVEVIRVAAKRMTE